jgi:error-prone DNA polymerase
MVHPYLRRRTGQEEVVYPHPSLEPVLRKTLGVPLFQEQVIRLAMVAADYSPGEADQLRRDMAAWRRAGRIERHRRRLVDRMTAKGIAPELAERVFEQIRGFGEYGFPESHAASFALIAYATAWMKCHHPEVFACALLNAQPMGFYSPATILEDAKRHGVEVRPVDVSHSEEDCTLEAAAAAEGRLALRMGLRFIKGLPEPRRRLILRARRDEPFDSPEDFVRRTGLDQRSALRLAEAGALSSLDPQRRSALWRTRGEVRSPRPELCAGEESAPSFRPLDQQEAICWDYRVTGHSPRGHPLAPLRRQLQARNLPDAESVAAMPNGRRVHYAGVVIGRQRPGTASGVVFVTLEDETGFVNLIVWSRVFERYAVLLKTTGFLGVTGTLQIQEGVSHVIAESFWRPDLRQQPVGVRSRDFH